MSRRRPGSICRWVLIAAALLATWGYCARGDDLSAEEHFLAGLRARRQFWLARQYCHERLADARLAPDARGELTMELSRTLADWAVQSPPDQREPLWEEAGQVAADFAARYPHDPRRLLVQFQAALASLARGELTRQEAELASPAAHPADAELTAARSHLRAAVKDLSALAEEAQVQARELARTRENGPDALPADELNALAYHINYQLARAYRNQGESYPPDSPDRISALSQAVALLDPLADLDPGHPLAWTARLDEIACQRLLGDFSAARRKLAALADLKPPADVLLRVRAETILVALAAGELAQAVRLAEPVLTDAAAAGSSSGWLDDAALQACLAAARQSRPEEAAGWLGKAASLAEAVERRHGPYWTRRAGMLLSRSVAGGAGSGAAADVGLLVRSAESAYRGGRIDDALAGYDRAAAQAAEQGDAARAFDLAYTAAAIEAQRGPAAGERYRQLARRWPDHPQAADAHYLALYHAGQVARRQSRDPAQSVELAREHLQQWPQSEHADEVRWLLGRLEEYRQDWDEAIRAYRAISPDALEFPEAIARAAGCYRRLFDARLAAGQSVEEPAKEAAGWLEAVVAPEGRWPEVWSPAARQAALAAAELRLNYTSQGFARAGEVLRAALQGDPSGGEAPADWRAAAEAMLVFSLAGQGERADAARVLAGLSSGPPEKLLTLATGLAQIAVTARPAVQMELAALELQALSLLQPRRGELSPGDQQRFDRLQPAALAAAGRADEALAAYRLLAKTYPRDAEIQEAYARLLAAGTDRASREAALAQWRALAAGSPRGSPRYFRAKYEVARLHLELGDAERARTIVAQLQLLHPDLGGPAQQSRFEELLRRCGP